MPISQLLNGFQFNNRCVVDHKVCFVESYLLPIVKHFDRKLLLGFYAQSRNFDRYCILINFFKKSIAQFIVNSVERLEFSQ